MQWQPWFDSWLTWSMLKLKACCTVTVEWFPHWVPIRILKVPKSTHLRYPKMKTASTPCQQLPISLHCIYVNTGNMHSFHTFFICSHHISSYRASCGCAPEKFTDSKMKSTCLLLLAAASDNDRKVGGNREGRIFWKSRFLCLMQSGEFYAKLNDLPVFNRPSLLPTTPSGRNACSFDEVTFISVYELWKVFNLIFFYEFVASRTV